MIDKGNESIRVLKKIYSLDNAICILGNHEYDFLKFYRAKIDWLDGLPAYVATEKYIGVHAGVPLEKDGTIKPIEQATTEQLVYDRNFKNPTTIVNEAKTVLYGHTPTSYLNGTGKIIAYPRKGGSGYSRVHLDTGVYLTGIMGCFCFESGSCFYVQRH